MDRKIFFLFLVFVIQPNVIFSQVPEAFKYQAIIRGSDGLPVAGKQVHLRVSIIRDDPGNMASYTEQHDVYTTTQGIVNLEIGGGQAISGSFQSIPWGTGVYFLKLEYDEAGLGEYANLGNSQLLSVPYAMFSGKTDTRATFEVTGIPGLDPDSALFVVKNKEGLPVFAVYQDGVRVYVEDNALKGGKGGFAVGGRGSAKGPVKDLMWVTSDSVRIYVDDHAGNKGGKGGFAVGSRSAGKGDIEQFTVLTPDNYFIGQGAGKEITSGIHNAFLGYRAGQNTRTGFQNVFLGYYAGFENDSGSSNVFIGDSSGFYNTGGYYNVFLGPTTGFKNTLGFQNIALGSGAGYSLQGGNRNIMIGVLAGNATTDGINNVFVGNAAGMSNTTGNFNVYLGRNAGIYSTTGLANVMVGHRAGFSNTRGSNNIFIGQFSGFMSDTNSANIFIGNTSGYSNHGGEGNVFLGNGTGYFNSTGFNNTLIGLRAGYNNNSGYANTFLGTYSGFYNNTGTGNTFIGNLAGQGNLSGNSNVYIGASAGADATGSNNLFLGNNAGRAETGSNKLYINNSDADKNNALIYGEFDNKILVVNGSLGLGVGSPAYRIELPNVANSSGQGRANAWLTYSDARFKDDITRIGNALELIEQLEGVNFTWKSDHKVSSGFIAQEVEKIIPVLVETDHDGIKSIDYSRLTPYLVNAIQEQQEQIKALQKRMADQQEILEKQSIQINDLLLLNKKLEKLEQHLTKQVQ
jgi:hypothetical protein